MIKLGQIRQVRKQQLRIRLTFVFLILIPLLWVSAIWCVYLYMFTAENYPAKARIDLEKVDWSTVVTYQDLDILPQQVSNYPLAGYELVDQELPAFASVDAGQSLLTFSPGKYDVGAYRIVLKPIASEGLATTRVSLELQVKLADIDWDKLQADLLNVMGDQQSHYGIYIKDLLRGDELKYQSDLIFPPGSISKLPTAVILLRDVDAGKIDLDKDTYPVTNALKHGTADLIAQYPQGTLLPIRTYLEQLLLFSSNTAHYHLRTMLGGNYEVLSPRMLSELGVDHLSEDPHEAQPEDVGRVFVEIYERRALSDASRDYFFYLLKNAAPSLKQAIPAGVPSGTQVANKVGFLFGGREGDIYNDSGVVFGNNTDYVLVVLNNSAPPFPQGSEMIKRISQVVYAALDAND
ncbi:serine hydrolase [Candidatus Dojkabacteria bacterium]|uniref:Serine hydrolase n=1 Tax=Candidatus Dojkabacteria bacterium TaxID=2099670 RepID=A0A955L050_9BACT|nr:serine hydrolase [Candidatus Dojkabacteria bacterium]